MNVAAAPIIEGYGEVEAAPVLIRRVNDAIRVAKPVRFPKSRLLISEHFRRAVAIAASNLKPDESGHVIVLLDADQDCAARLGPELLDTMPAHLKPGGFVAVAVREFESWIVGGIGEIGVNDPDSAGDPKGLIRRFNGDRYKETADQAKLTARIDVSLLESRSQSFQRFARWLRGLTEQPQGT